MKELNYMVQYISLHKNGEEVVGALQFSIGYDEANKICETAINNKKKIVLKTDSNKLDYLAYTFK
jgi:hypothetical protein